MTKVSRTRPYDVFIAIDGEEFSSQTACYEYEQTIKDLTKVWCVYDKKELIGIFSSEEKAKKWDDSYSDRFNNRFKIKSQYIDEKEIK